MIFLQVRSAITLLLLLWVGGVFHHPAEASGHKHVLILNSYHQGMDWTDGETVGIRESFENYGPVEFHIEYMDTKRSLDTTHFDNLRQLFSHKYRSIQLDAIVVTDNDAYDFMRHHRDKLFPRVPVVFCGVNWFRDEQLDGLSKFTGVAESADNAATIKLMLQIHPDTQRIVVVIDDTTTGKVLRSELESIADALKGRIQFEFLVALPTNELSVKLSALGANDLVLLMPYASDRSGTFITYPEIAKLVTGHSTVPVYASWDFYLGYGIVGGNLTTAKAQGNAAGEMLQRILNGEKVENLFVLRQIPGQTTFDYRQLTRFNISKSRLPENSVIAFQPWHQSNKPLIWTFVLIGAILITLLWALLNSMARKRQADVELRIAAKAFDLQVAMLVTDHSGVIMRINPAFTKVTGYSEEEAIGQKTTLLKSGRHDQAFYENLWNALSEQGFWQGVIWNRRKNGSIFAEWLTINSVVAPTGVITHYVCSFTDITHNKDAEAEVHRLGYYDQLTQLPNRRLLQDRLGQALAQADRNGSYGAVLFLDLDDFSTLNDTRGHETGDQLLLLVAQRLRQSLRDADTVARPGGDEFVIVLEDLGKDIEEAATRAKHVGNQLCASIAQPYDLKGQHCNSTASIGICLFHGNESVEELLKNADIAMYQAKASGRNTPRFFDPDMQRALDKRSILENDLRQALNRQELMLYYQAQVDRTGQIVGAEILLRWKHPDRGFISPVEFIPLAEDTGLILPIGQWVLEGAFKQMKAWSDHGVAQKLRISVNVSPRQFRQDDFVHSIRQLIENTGVVSIHLELELTESLVLDDVENTIEKMLLLKELGVSFSMDDFGTGYSSLSYLTRLPLDELKIDKSFVANLPGNHNDEVIAQTIITMGKSLGLRVVAEGVETEAQRSFLNEHGCHTYQGYYYSRPVPIDEFMALLQQNER
ncbi:MAG: ABC transporter substrate binding protein [Betaproteobacteria bacterium]